MDDQQRRQHCNRLTATIEVARAQPLPPSTEGKSHATEGPRAPFGGRGASASLGRTTAAMYFSTKLGRTRCLQRERDPPAAQGRALSASPVQSRSWFQDASNNWTMQLGSQPQRIPARRPSGTGEASGSGCTRAVLRRTAHAGFIAPPVLQLHVLVAATRAPQAVPKRRVCDPTPKRDGRTGWSGTEPHLVLGRLLLHPALGKWRSPSSTSSLAA
jgi:hypothetical protein